MHSFLSTPIGGRPGAFGLWVEGLHDFGKLSSGDELVHLGEKKHASARLAVFLKAAIDSVNLRAANVF